MKVGYLKRRGRDFYYKAKSGECFHVYRLPEDIKLPVAIYWEEKTSKLLAGMIIRESSQISIGSGSSEWFFKQVSNYSTMKIELLPQLVPSIPKSESKSKIKWNHAFMLSATPLL